MRKSPIPVSTAATSAQSSNLVTMIGSKHGKKRSINDRLLMKIYDKGPKNATNTKGKKGIHVPVANTEKSKLFRSNSAEGLKK